MKTAPKPTIDSALASALRPYGEFIYPQMSALAQKHNAVNLAQGFPEHDGPPEVHQRAAEALVRGWHQYTPPAGTPEFRRAIAASEARFNGVDVDPDREVLVTSGAQEAIASCILGMVEPGDEVILVEPYYLSYPPTAALAHAVVKTVSLDSENLSLPRDALERAFSPKTRAIIVNTPNNPIGKVFSREELELIAEFCNRFDAYYIGDDVYQHLVFDGHQHVSALSIPRLRDRAVTIASLGKSFSVTGWRLGYLVGAAPLVNAARLAHMQLGYCTPGPLQDAGTFALGLPDSYFEELAAEHQSKRDFLCDGLAALGCRMMRPQGTYFCNLDIRSIGFRDDLELCHTMPAEAGVAAIPTSLSWRDRHDGRHLIRLCFAKKQATLQEAVDRIGRWMDARRA